MLEQTDRNYQGLFNVMSKIGLTRLLSSFYKFIILLLFFSCFLLTMESDSIDGIYETLKKCALISKTAGGIGLSIHKIRSSGSYIAGVRKFCYCEYYGTHSLLNFFL